MPLIPHPVAPPFLRKVLLLYSLAQSRRHINVYFFYGVSLARFAVHGTVRYLTLRAKQDSADLGEHKHFALKALAKKAVIERGQLAHVKDEKLLLQNMKHALILQLFSTFQVSVCVCVCFVALCPPLLCSRTWGRWIDCSWRHLFPCRVSSYKYLAVCLKLDANSCLFCSYHSGNSAQQRRPALQARMICVRSYIYTYSGGVNHTNPPM